MKRNILYIFIFYSFIFCLSTKSLFSQTNKTGTLRGTVTAADTKLPLPFANVMIVGTNNGTATDMKGKFILRDILLGKHKIKITYVGYGQKILKVIVHPNETTFINVILTPHNIQIKKVVVTAQASGQLKAINEQINSKDIINVVAPDRIQEIPEANAAEAIGRLPGISLIRSGGEGQGVVIRGLAPKYSKILVDGIQIPSTNPNNRSTNISSISQYILQGISVYKTITPDMDGDATGGVINLKLTKAPSGFHFHILSEGGYNNLNKYWKNYNFQANVSNRFLENKLGMQLNIGSGSVIRSAQSTTSSYSIITSATQNNYQKQPLYINAINLNDQYRLNNRSTASLILDYKYSPESNIVFFSFFSHLSQDNRGVSKSFNLANASRNIMYTFTQDKGDNSELFISSLKGKNNINLFNLTYGIAYSQTHKYTPNSRVWRFINAGGVPSALTDTSSRRLPIGTIVNAVKDSMSKSILERTRIWDIGVSSQNNIDREITAYFDSKVNLQFSNSINGVIKFGFKYKYEKKNRYWANYAQNVSSQNIPQFGDSVKNNISWVDIVGRALTANGFQDHIVNSFQNGRFYFGWYPNFNRLNQFFDWFANFSHYYKTHPNINPPFAENKTFLNPSVTAMQNNNYSFDQKYYAVYIMGELNLGNWLTFIPGVRYEKVLDNLTGWYAIQIPFPIKPFGHPVFTTHKDEYYLPDYHLIIKPTDWMNIHIAYTNSLNRPDYISLVPITYINTSGLPQILKEGNPNLKPEHWANYDLQVSFYNNALGYLSIDGFYKKAKDVIWTPVYVRTPGEPPIPGFENIFGKNAVVNIIQPVNNNYTIFVKGLELDWQTNFWYLPEPFNKFSMYFNYTLMKSATKYPRTVTVNKQVGTDNRGRPIFKLVTNYYVDNGPMINQPDNIVNFSLGYNYKGLDLWFSYQFSGQKLSGFNPQPELSSYHLSFQRYDLQITQKLPIRNLELLFNFANINNPTEISKLKGDVRPNYLENYGWTMNLGVRYKL